MLQDPGNLDMHLFALPSARRVAVVVMFDFYDKRAISSVERLVWPSWGSKREL